MQEFVRLVCMVVHGLNIGLVSPSRHELDAYGIMSVWIATQNVLAFKPCTLTLALAWSGRDQLAADRR